MKIVFIAGPYNAQTREGIEANIANAREYAVEMNRLVEMEMEGAVG